ncbi:MAG: hypothetical protein K6A82_00660 [Prevotella sp.]|nr:hypothetical protein [Prevotella sp.]
MSSKRIVLATLCLHLVFMVFWVVGLLFSLGDSILHPTFSRVLFYGAACTSVSWLFLFGWIVDQVASRNKPVAVLLIVFFLGLSALGSFVFIFVFSLFAPKDIWYEDGRHMVTSGEATTRCFYVYEKHGLTNRIKDKYMISPSLDVNSARWMFYDRLGVMIAQSDNALFHGDAEPSKVYNLYITDSIALRKYQRETTLLYKSLIQKEGRYLVSGEITYQAEHPSPSYTFEYDTKTHAVVTGGDDGRQARPIVLSEAANDSVIAAILRCPDGVSTAEDTSYGEGQFCIRLEVNGRLLLDIYGSDICKLPRDFLQLIRLLAEGSEQGRNILKKDRETFFPS